MQTRFSKPNMISDHVRTMSQQAGRWKKWGWKCPSDSVLAGYIDGVLDDAVRSRTESHLADCAECRTLIGDVVTMRRLEVTPLPLGLRQRAIALPASNRMIRRWILIPAALAGITLVLIGGFLLRVPRNEIGPISRPPVAPMMAKSEPASAPGQATPDVVRKSASSELLPMLISPKKGRVITPSELILKWKLVPQAKYYEIHVVTSEGDPVWQGQSEETETKLSRDVTLKDGTYFVWIAAYLEGGRVQKSPPVRFVVNASQ